MNGSVYIALQILPKDIALLKYYLEAQDNLGYLRVLDAKIALLHAISSKDLYTELYAFLYGIQKSNTLSFSFIKCAI